MPMDLDRLSMELERAIEEARHFAERRGEGLITVNHLLYAMLDKGGVLRSFAEKQGLPDHLLDFLTTRASEDGSGRKLEAGKRPVAGKSLRDTLDKAFEVSAKRRSDVAEAMDFLAAVLESGEEALRNALREAGFTADGVRK